MTDIVQFILFLWMFFEINFFLRRAKKTTADLGYEGNELRTLADRRREFQDAESSMRGADQEWQKLQPAIAQTRRRKDGKFDERSKLGRMLNREVPRVRRIRKQAGQKRASAKRKLAAIESLPGRRVKGWVRAASLRAASRQAMVALPVMILIGGAAETPTPGNRAGVILFLWCLAVALLALGYSSATRRKITP
ncbi:MAG TPA: hypothetical protein EYQ54_09995 [Myxococcales bacterium]|nr:hypothetical protein [Myxococcales bacterium]